MVAVEALWQLELDELRLVPARIPPHKPAGPWTSAERRAAWVEAAAAEHEGLVASRIELLREGPSYTADTLEEMAAAEPGARLWFVLGADQLSELPRWRDPQRILAAARLAVVPREGRSRSELQETADRVAPGRVDWLDVPEIGISSSLVRARAAAGRPFAHLLPAPVAEAVRREGLVPSATSDAPRKDTSSPRSI